MIQWFQHNFWWFLPGVVGPIVIALTYLARRKFSPAPMPRSWPERWDAAAKWVLVLFAFLLAYVAFSTHSYLALVLPIFGS